MHVSNSEPIAPVPNRIEQLLLSLGYCFGIDEPVAQRVHCVTSMCREPLRFGSAFSSDSSFREQRSPEETPLGAHALQQGSGDASLKMTNFRPACDVPDRRRANLVRWLAWLEKQGSACVVSGVSSQAMADTTGMMQSVTSRSRPRVRAMTRPTRPANRRFQERLELPRLPQTA
jgi:hypothetical protein